MKLFSARLSHREKIVFTKHLSVLIASGVSLSDALDTLILQQARSASSRIFSSLLKDVQNGQTLTDALAKFPSTFDPYYLGLIKIGEQSGNLESNLNYLAEQLNADLATKNKIRAAMLYPALVLLLTFSIGGFLAFYILPQLITFFDAFDTTLPFTTRVLLGLANFTRNYGLLLLLTLVTIFIALTLLGWLRPVRKFYHLLLLRLPLLGSFVTTGLLTRFSRNLSVLLKSGVPINDSLIVIADTSTNLVYQDSLKQIVSAIASGTNLADALARFPRFYPALLQKMVNVGEKSGRLAETLAYLSNTYEEEIDTQSKNLTTLLEPVLLIIIGAMVAFVALAIISPIYQLTGSLHS